MFCPLDHSLTTKDSIGTKISLVWRAISGQHSIVDGPLVGNVESLDDIGEDGINVVDGLGDALSHVPRSAIAKLDGLVDAGGRARRNAGGERSLGGGDIHLDGGVAARVDNFASLHAGDGGHGPLGDHARGPTEGGGGGGRDEHGGK